MKLVDPDGRDWYDIDKSGYVRRDEKKSQEFQGKDIIHSTWNDKQLELEQGTIEKATNNERHDYEFNEGGISHSGSEVGTQLNINANEKTAKAIYDFCISNTDRIEFSLTQGNGAGTEWYVSTSHKREEDAFSAALGYSLALAGSFYSHQHNHPDLGIYGKMASDGDKRFMHVTTAIMRQTNKNASPSYKLAIISKGEIKNLNYNGATGYFE